MVLVEKLNKALHAVSVNRLKRKSMQFTEHPQNPALFYRRHCKALEMRLNTDRCGQMGTVLRFRWNQTTSCRFPCESTLKKIISLILSMTSISFFLQYQQRISGDVMDKKVKGKFGNNEQEAQVRLQVGDLRHFRVTTPLHSSSLANNTVKQLISLSFLLEWRFVPIYISW